MGVIWMIITTKLIPMKQLIKFTLGCTLIYFAGRLNNWGLLVIGVILLGSIIE